MIEEMGVVSQVEGAKIWVKTQIKTTCSACEAQTNCGTGVVAKAFHPKEDELVFTVDEALSVGQKVKLGIPESQFLHASMLVYALPLFVLLGSAILGSWLLPQLGFVHELWLVLLVNVSVSASFFLVKNSAIKNQQSRFQPRFLGIIDENDLPIFFVPENNSRQ